MNSIAKDMDRLIVISDPGNPAEEASLLNRMFAAGLSLLHLRKPEHKPDELYGLLNAIDPAYRERIVLPFSLAGDRRLPFPEYSKVHFFEALRQRTKPEYFGSLQSRGYTLSTSVHDVATMETLSSAFTYTFLGPVFDSISKPGYTGMNRDTLQSLPVNRKIKVFALGGIDEHNCGEALSYGFDGVAVLGAVWNSKAPLEQFKKIQQCLMNGR